MELNTKIEFANLNDDLILYECLCGLGVSSKRFMGRVANTYKFPNHDANEFILMLQKSIYLFEYMNNLEDFHKNLLPEKFFLQSSKHGGYR